VSRENVEIVRRLYNAVAERDSETVLSIYHPEVVWDHTHNTELAGLMGGQTLFHGHEGVRRWSRDFYEAWDDVEAELEDLVDAGDEVVVVLNYRGRGRVSGIEVGLTRMAGVLTIRDEQIVRAVWYRDGAEALRAAGIESRPATPDE
jgi:ketosteroid isomerase-like protein